MSSRLLVPSSLLRPSLSGARDRGVRVWWNSCLHPSFSRPSCRCIHSLPYPPRRFVAVGTASAVFPPHPLWALTAPRVGLRFFSSPSLASSTSDSSVPPSFSPSPSTSSPLPSSSASPPLSDAVQLTDAAAARIGQLKAKHGKGMRLRLSVDSGGCSGLSYKFEMDTQGQQEDDCEFRHGEGAVLVDAVSLSLLKGSVIDFTQRIERSGFEVLSNPNSAAKCGCGSSFQPKHF